MFSLLIELHHNLKIEEFVEDLDAKNAIQKIMKFLFFKCDYLLSARPTAINLTNIVEDLKHFVKQKIDFNYQLTAAECIYEFRYRFLFFCCCNKLILN